MTDDRLLISLEPTDRSWLHQRIAQRFDAMLARGFIEEVKALRARGDLHADLPAMRCVGYRQAWEYLDAHGARGRGDTTGLHELRDKGVFATRQLAKRQLTWLRSMPERQVVPCDAPDALNQVLALAQAYTQQLPVDLSLRAQRGNPGLHGSVIARSASDAATRPAASR